MSDSAINVDRVLDLAGVICDEGASDSEFAETDACLLIDQLSCNDYLNYCWMHVALTMESRIHRAVQQVHQQINMGLVVPAIPVASDLDAVKVVAPVSPAPAFPATLFNSTVGFFSSDWPVAYLVATVIFGIGLLIGSSRVCVPAGAGRQAIRPSPRGSAAELSPQWSAGSRAWLTASGLIQDGACQSTTPCPWAASMHWHPA